MGTARALTVWPVPRLGFWVICNVGVWRGVGRIVRLIWLSLYFEYVGR